MHFRLYVLRFTFKAREALVFPPGNAGNRLRGAFGSMLYKLEGGPIFAPSSKAGPSGIVDQPRPFVFRASHLDGKTIASGDSFSFDFHWFDMRDKSLDIVLRAFRELVRDAELVEVTGTEAPVELRLDPPSDPVNHLTIRFETPTELKAGGGIVERPEFGVLAARIRDRISTLRELYDDGALSIDFQKFGKRADRIRMTRCDIQHVESSRRSGRTGQVHSLGGFVGEAEYEGDLTEFVPYIRAARFTGVGRQTAWGKGELTLYTVRSEV